MEPQRQLDRLLGLKLDRYANHVARQRHAGELLRADRYVHDRNAGKQLIPSLQQKLSAGPRTATIASIFVPAYFLRRNATRSSS